jgi:hypothetical protein
MISKTQLGALVFDRISDRTDISFEAFMGAISRWDLIPCPSENNIKAIVMCCENMLHVVATSPKRWATKGLARRFLVPILAQYGEIHSTVMNDYAAGHELARRMGFKEIHKDDTITYYRLTEVKYVR